MQSLNTTFSLQQPALTELKPLAEVLDKKRRREEATSAPSSPPLSQLPLATAAKPKETTNKKILNTFASYRSKAPKGPVLAVFAFAAFKKTPQITSVYTGMDKSKFLAPAPSSLPAAKTTTE